MNKIDYSFWPNQGQLFESYQSTMKDELEDLLPGVFQRAAFYLFDIVKKEFKVTDSRGFSSHSESSKFFEMYQKNYEIYKKPPDFFTAVRYGNARVMTLSKTIEELHWNDQDCMIDIRFVEEIGGFHLFYVVFLHRKVYLRTCMADTTSDEVNTIHFHSALFGHLHKINEYFSQQVKAHLDKTYWLYPRPSFEQARELAFASEIAFLIGQYYTKNAGVTIYDTLNEISAFRYEKRIQRNSILVKSTHEAAESCDVAFTPPIRIDEVRRVRKILEMGSKDIDVVSDMIHVFGLRKRRLESVPSPSKYWEDCRVTFTDLFCWRLSFAGKTHFDVRHGKGLFPREPLDPEEFGQRFVEHFSVSYESASAAASVVALVEACKVGAVIVFSKNAPAEAKRLQSQSLSVRPFSLSEAPLAELVSIDGAILSDEHSNCFALGVILDGIVSEKGNPSRGSRYNSAQNYYHSRSPQDTLMVVVLSEDGMIDIIPRNT